MLGLLREGDSAASRVLEAHGAETWQPRGKRWADWSTAACTVIGDSDQLAKSTASLLR